ncbi:MAG: SH3 domain-containing protein [Lachnospiraceae bacterium]|nr:SH3 domain-containing protein [Lachnospiraceae bacterium]
MDNDSMKKVTDFFVKYKKNLCAAVLLVVLVLVLVKCAGPTEKEKDTQSGTETVTPATEYAVTGKLQKDAEPELTQLMQNYYSAYAAGDIATLEMLAQPLSENEKSYIATFSEYYEDYQNIVTYSMPGESEDSYLVSVCYDLKFRDVDTAAPGMDFFYVERDGKGKLYINNVYSAYNFNFMDQELDANLYSLILAYEKSEEVTALQQEVQTKYDEAIKSDEKLANMVGGTLRNAMSKWRDAVIEQSESQSTESQSTETQAESQTEEATEQETQKAEEKEKESDEKKDEEKKDEEEKTDSGKVKTLDICNVRKSPSTDGELLGKVDIGVTLKKLGTEGDWTKVKFQGETGYIKTEFLKTVKSKKK